MLHIVLAVTNQSDDRECRSERQRRQKQGVIDIDNYTITVFCHFNK